MSLFGAMSTAVSGLSAQTGAFGNISDNIANSQTTGFKRTDTAFLDYLTTATPEVHDSGTVVAVPQYENAVQGSITQSDNPLAFAVSGQGFFPVSRATDSVNGLTTFDPQQYYTRAGNFQLDKDGYVVNTAGDYLNGWSVDSAGLPDRNSISPIQVTQTVDSPVSTGNVKLEANLPSYNDPANPPSGTAGSAVDVYDSQGGSHQLSISFSPTTGTPNSWDVSVTDSLGNVLSPAGSVVTFNPDGTLATINGGTPTPADLALSVPGPAGTPATTWGPQTINLNLGTINGNAGLTQYAGAQYSVRGISQDGVPPGAFSSLTTTSNGDIIANFDNGQSRVVARVPVMTFPAPDALAGHDGQSYTATTASGAALAHDAGTAGAGQLITKATEASNVDISSEFSKLIVAQRAYSANAKLVTTADDMLQTTIDMKR